MTISWPIVKNGSFRLLEVIFLHGYLIQLCTVSFLALFNAFVQFALIPFQASFRTPLEAYAELFCTYVSALVKKVYWLVLATVVIANRNVARRIKATDIVLAYNWTSEQLLQ